MPSTYGVSVLDVIKSRQDSDKGTRDAVKHVFVPLHAAVLLVDLLCTTILWVIVCGWSWDSIKHAFTAGSSELFSWDHAAFDCLMLAVARVVLFPLLTWCGVVLGTPDYQAAAPTAERTKSDPETAAQDTMSEPLVCPPCSEADGSPNLDAAKALANATDPAKKDARWHAKARKYTILAVIFLMSTAVQIYLGLKVSTFEFGEHKTIKACVIASCI